jgi:hypothetical protein
MSTASITANLDRKLSTIGFRRRNKTWNRENGSLVDVIDVQVSKSGDLVTINTGVLSRAVYSTMWGHESGLFIDEPSCTVRARVGQLLDNKDRWWRVESDSSAEEMMSCIEVCVFPFLNRMQSLGAMRDWLASSGLPSPKWPAPSVCFAVVQFYLGNTEDACITLRELERNALGGWRAEAKKVAVRIGCA